VTGRGLHLAARVSRAEVDHFLAGDGGGRAVRVQDPAGRSIRSGPIRSSMRHLPRPSGGYRASRTDRLGWAGDAGLPAMMRCSVRQAFRCESSAAVTPSVACRWKPYGVSHRSASLNAALLMPRTPQHDDHSAYNGQRGNVPPITTTPVRWPFRKVARHIGSQRGLSKVFTARRFCPEHPRLTIAYSFVADSGFLRPLCVRNTRVRTARRTDGHGRRGWPLC